MRQVILRNHQSPGDLIVLTAALRDLHATHPGEFQTGLDTSCPEVFAHNPHVAPLNGSTPVLDLHYPSVHESNESGLHFIEGLRNDVAALLGVPIAAGPLRPALYLSDEEREQVCEYRDGRPLWIINAGSKLDFTAKQWSHARWQGVVDALHERVHFVQVGTLKHEHPRLSHVTSLIGQTTLRELIVLISQADGVVCPITACMHIAAAFQKKCVVVAGGRERDTWERYEGHAFLHTIGKLPCCAGGGCWKSRTVALGDGAAGVDGEPLDSRLCEAPVEAEHGQWIPRCLDRISVADVVQAVETLL